MSDDWATSEDPRWCGDCTDEEAALIRQLGGGDRIAGIVRAQLNPQEAQSETPEGIRIPRGRYGLGG